MFKDVVFVVVDEFQNFCTMSPDLYMISVVIGITHVERLSIICRINYRKKLNVTKLNKTTVLS